MLAGWLPSDDDRVTDPYQNVLAYLGLGAYDAVFEWLDRALDYRSRDLVLLGVSPIADPLRHTTRFRDFMQRTALPQVAPN